MEFQSSLHIVGLLRKHLEGVLTVAEGEELNAWVGENSERGELLRDVEDAEWVQRELMLFNKYSVARGKERAYGKIEQRKGNDKVSVINMKWFRYAAVLLLVAGAGVYFWVGNRNISDSNRVSEVKVKDDIVPGRDRAVLTLGDGRTIVLDDAGKGALAKQGEVNIVKLGEGQLAYDASAGSGGKKGEVLYNTISTPRGGQYQIVLPDGSRVWLNAASSIKFPAVFGDVRVVEMTGEVYMEVASGAAGGEKRMGSRKPFFIRTNGMEVQVLGTSFNVNAYKDEGVMRTTLVDGRVKILVGNGDGLLLGAGEQAEVKGGDVSLVKGVDVGKEVAWKNGYFEFSNTDIESVMRQLARWYDLEVRYEGKVNYMFSASIPRNVPIVKLLKALEMTGGVRFEMEGKRVVVKGV